MVFAILLNHQNNARSIPQHLFVFAPAPLRRRLSLLGNLDDTRQVFGNGLADNDVFGV
jgi:hypothetical protein